MHPDKFPDPDGMIPRFYQKCWNIVKPDVTTIVRNFFETGVLDDELKNMNIELISLCNVVYKIRS